LVTTPAASLSVNEVRLSESSALAAEVKPVRETVVKTSVFATVADAFVVLSVC
jgi:hypothetical protein